MAILLKGDTVEIYKFHSTGLVALCREVVEFIDDGSAEKYNLDIDAKFREDAQGLYVVFKKRSK
jgi:hypothetical protein